MTSYVIQRFATSRFTQLLTAVPSLMVHSDRKAFLIDDPVARRTRLHQSVIALAKRDRLPYVWVVEDDCQFTESFDLDWWESLAEWMLDSGVHVLSGGLLWVRTPVERLSEDIVQVAGMGSTHCVIYQETAYDKLLSFPHDKHFDVSISDCKELVKAATVPFVAVQRDEPGQMSYVKWYDSCLNQIERSFRLTST